MATFQDNLNTINTAIYGKEMRPAISGALTQSWDAVKIMMHAVDHLNARIDALPDPGGGGGTVDPDNPDVPPSAGYNLTGYATPIIKGSYTPLDRVGFAEEI